jgi:hypothetical protein
MVNGRRLNMGNKLAGGRSARRCPGGLDTGRIAVYHYLACVFTKMTYIKTFKSRFLNPVGVLNQYFSLFAYSVPPGANAANGFRPEPVRDYKFTNNAGMIDLDQPDAGRMWLDVHPDFALAGLTLSV